MFGRREKHACIMLCFHFEHAQAAKTMQNQTKATICGADGNLAGSRPTKSTAFYELPLPLP